MIVQDRKLWIAEYDLSGHLSGAALEASVEMQDDTVFGDTFRSNAPGLGAFTLQHEGVWSAGAGLPDTVFDEHKGLADLLATVAPVDGDAGSLAYFMRVTQGSYSLGGTVGDLHRFSVSLEASGGIGAVRGSILANDALDETADGTAFQLGAAASGKTLYAAMHVLSAEGTDPTLDVLIESDSAEAMSSPTTRITFAQVTEAGTLWATPVAGPITDTWWRASWTVGGTSPSFDAVIVVGIQ